jgi:hypothetical protein
MLTTFQTSKHLGTSRITASSLGESKTTPLSWEKIYEISFGDSKSTGLAILRFLGMMSYNYEPQAKQALWMSKDFAIQSIKKQLHFIREYTRRSKNAPQEKECWRCR